MSRTMAEVRAECAKLGVQPGRSIAECEKRIADARAAGSIIGTTINAAAREAAKAIRDEIAPVSFTPPSPHGGDASAAPVHAIRASWFRQFSKAIRRKQLRKETRRAQRRRAA